MGVLAGLSGIQRYVAIGLAVALAASIFANGVLTKLYLGQRDKTAAAVAQCNADKHEAIAAAEKIVREAEQQAAERRIQQIEAVLAQEVVSTANERERRVQAEHVAETRRAQLQKLAEGGLR